MATRLEQALKQKGTHSVGNLTSIQVKTVAHGAKVIEAPIDNFTLVELGFDAQGERTAKQLSDKGNKSYLIASPEARNLGEQLSDFYNEVGELVRIVVLEPNYTRFDTSAFTLNSAVDTVAAGQVAHFDVTTKKFIVSKSESAHADYATSSAQFVVVLEDELDEQATIRLECTKA